MYGCFTKYGNWEMNIINTCQRFYEKYDRYPTCIMEFGTNDDDTVSFKTNKFELFFLIEETLPEDSYIVQYGEGPYDGGEDYDESECEETPLLMKLAA